MRTAIATGNIVQTKEFHLEGNKLTRLPHEEILTLNYLNLITFANKTQTRAPASYHDSPVQSHTRPRFLASLKKF